MTALTAEELLSRLHPKKPQTYKDAADYEGVYTPQQYRRLFRALMDPWEEWKDAPDGSKGEGIFFHIYRKSIFNTQTRIFRNSMTMDYAFADLLQREEMGHLLQVETMRKLMAGKLEIFLLSSFLANPSVDESVILEALKKHVAEREEADENLDINFTMALAKSPHMKGEVANYLYPKLHRNGEIEAFNSNKVARKWYRETYHKRPLTANGGHAEVLSPRTAFRLLFNGDQKQNTQPQIATAETLKEEFLSLYRSVALLESFTGNENLLKLERLQTSFFEQNKLLKTLNEAKSTRAVSKVQNECVQKMNHHIKLLEKMLQASYQNPLMEEREKETINDFEEIILKETTRKQANEALKISRN